jgi:hypothetical protein
MLVHRHALTSPRSKETSMPLFWDHAQMVDAGYGPDILAEGDSWFSYWLPDAGNLLNAVDRMLAHRDLGILTLAQTGDQARDMLTGSSREDLIEYFCAYRMKIRTVMFSGGGNDITSTRMIEILKPDCSAAANARDCFRVGQPERRLDEIAAAYRELVILRDRYCSRAQILVHCYDYAVPDGRGVLGSMGWLQPPMNFCKVPADMGLRKRIVALLIDGMAHRLGDLERAGAGFHFVDTRNTLAYPEQWRDELHPTAQGHAELARRFVPCL